MGRKPIDPKKVKTNLTISLRLETIEKLKSIKGYNVLIQKLIDDYFANKV